MKIYSVQIVEKGFYQHGSSILTASESEANRIREFWQNEADKRTDKKLEVKIYEYEVKTQGKNFGEMALAHKYQIS